MLMPRLAMVEGVVQAKPGEILWMTHPVALANPAGRRSNCPQPAEDAEDPP